MILFTQTSFLQRSLCLSNSSHNVHFFAQTVYVVTSTTSMLKHIQLSHIFVMELKSL